MPNKTLYLEAQYGGIRPEIKRMIDEIDFRPDPVPSLITPTLITAAALLLIGILFVQKAPRAHRVLALTALALVALVLFPPFHFQWPNGFATNEGYGFLFDPPHAKMGPSDNLNQARLASVDVSLLFIELLVVSAVGGVAHFILRPLNAKNVDPLK